MNIAIIDATKPSKCELCGKMADTMPFGLNDAYICIKCAGKDKKGTKERAKKLFAANDIVVVKDELTTIYMK